MPSLAVGDVLAKHTLTSLETSTVEIPDGKHLVHLQFRRFAGCPFCNLHLHSVKQRYEENDADENSELRIGTGEPSQKS